MKSLLEFKEQEVSVEYLKGLLKNSTNKFAIGFLTSWIKKENKGKVNLSTKEYNILNLIKTGGPYPKDFGTKN